MFMFFSVSTQLKRRVFPLFAAVLALALSFGLSSAHADGPGYPDDYPKMSPFEEATRGYYLTLDGINTYSDTYSFAIYTEPGVIGSRAYCTEIEVDAIFDELPDHDGIHDVGSWDEFPNTGSDFDGNPDNQAKAGWVAANSYPELSLAELITASGLGTALDGLTEKEAIAATQAAIWHFTDGVDLTGIVDFDPTSGAATTPFAANSPEALRTLALYNYLVDPATNVGITEPAKLTLSATGPSEPGIAGDTRYGPFKIDSSAATVRVAGAPAAFIDGAGNAVDMDAVPTGVDLFFDIPAGVPAGNANLVIEATGNYTGLLLITKNERGQTVMMSGADDVTLSTELAMSWKAAEPTPTPTEAPTVTPTPSGHPTVILPSLPESGKPNMPETGC